MYNFHKFRIIAGRSTEVLYDVISIDSTVYSDSYMCAADFIRNFGGRYSLSEKKKNYLVKNSACNEEAGESNIHSISFLIFL